MSLFNKKQIISAIENTKVPLLYYFLSFFSFIIIENFLEIFSDPGIVPFKLFPFSHWLAIPASASIAIHVMHCSLWWIAVVLLLPLIFTYITKESIDKTARAILSFSWLIILTPIVDLVLSGGKGINIHYVSPEKIPNLFYVPFELTPGENLTAAIILILAFIYCLTKTGKVIKAILGTLLISFGVLIAFLLPPLMRVFAGLFRIGLESITPVLVSRFLIFVIFIELVTIFYLQNKNYFLSIVKNIGFLKTLHFILMFILGMLLFRVHIGRFILENIGSFLLSAVSIALIWTLANIISDLDKQKTSQSEYRNIAIVVFFIACVCALSVNFITLYFIVLGTGTSIIYLLAPFRLKRLPLFAKIILSFNLLLLIILGWLFAGGDILEFPHIFSLYFLIFPTICMNFVDIKDYSIDKKDGIRTLSVELGEKRAKFIIGFAFVISYIAASWLFLEKILFLPASFLGLFQFYLINHKNYKEGFVFLTHLVSLIGLLIWLNFFRIPI